MHERGQHRVVDVADRPVHGAVAVEGDHRPVVVALHEPGADDLGDDDGQSACRRPYPPDAGTMSRVRPHPSPSTARRPRELDDLELLSHGALGHAGFEGPGSPVTLHVPTAVATAAVDAGAIELVDPEGLPLARVDAGRRRGGLTDDRHQRPVTPLSHHEYGAFRRLHLSPTQARGAVRRPHAPVPVPHRSPTRTWS